MTTSSLPPWKALRDASGLSQREIERRAGFKTGRLSVIERGLIPTDQEAATLRRVLLEALNTTTATGEATA